MLEKSIMQRLATIRYVHTMAIDQSGKPQPFNMTAILLFHDAIELFLALASEYLDVGKAGRPYMEYWDAINQKLPNKDFAQKDAMRRLNVARGNFKHQAIVIAPSEIEAFRLSVASFFSENTQKVFAIEFDDVSMSSLILEDAVRTRLEEAEILRSKGDITTATKEIAIAFQELLYQFKWRFFEEKQTFPFEPRAFSRIHSLRSSTKELATFAKEVKEALSSLSEQIKILSLGIDYHNYVRFQRLTPYVSHVMGAEGSRYLTSGDGHVQSNQEYTFCYNFVIESALRLQEFTM